MKKLGHIASVFALLIILAHNVVPHYHQAYQSATITSSDAHEGNHNLFCFITHMFSVDLGEEHLEDFARPSGDDLKIQSPKNLLGVDYTLFYSGLEIFSPRFEYSSPPPETSRQFSLPSLHLALNQGMRAPPVARA